MSTEAETRATPGPWRMIRTYGGDPAGLHHPRPEGQADDVCYFYTDDERSPSEADAELMGAAPELADALADVRELLIYARCEPDYPFTAEEEDEILSRAAELLERVGGDKWWRDLGQLSVT